MTPLEEMIEATLAKIAAAKTPEEARQIANTFRDEGYDNLIAWHNGEDVTQAPARAVTTAYRDLFGGGDKADAAMADAVNRVSDAANARSCGLA